MKFDFCWHLFAAQKGGDSLCLSICKTNTALTIIIDKKRGPCRIFYGVFLLFMLHFLTYCYLLFNLSYNLLVLKRRTYIFNKMNYIQTNWDIH
jgi:hypothetical protein